MLKRLAIAALALLLTAETPPPPALLPYIRDGRFDPGDYSWMRGAFEGATAAQNAEWQSIMQWRKQCGQEDRAAVRETMRRHGVTVSGTDNNMMGTGLCGEVGYALPEGNQGQSWPTFQAAAARAEPIAQAVTWSAALAQKAADPDTPGLAADLIARPTTDQVLRWALPWNKGDVGGAPPLDPAALGIARSRLWLAISERDHANTAWLKTIVAAQGWPTIGKVGKDAAHMAWLLVQHADDDPVFQFDMLRLMEPLAMQGEVAKKDYAYLYDRVMLQLTGKQRYASQYTCIDGRHAPRPLEDGGRSVDGRRSEMGMDSVAENVARMDKSYGPCPPPVLPASSSPR